MSDFEVIETKADLDVLAQDLQSEKVIGVDTEADSFYHYFDKTCLVQIATRKQIYLIDPLALGGPAELAPLGPVFASPETTTIFHAAEYDLFVLKRDCGFSFDALFDTMISAQLLGYPSVGLASLAERHYGVNLPKDEQRSDWSRRPLRDKQLNYAAADVVYLIALREILTKELRAAKRLRWAQEEFKTLCARQWPEREFDKLGYLRIKGARKLDPNGLSVLRELYYARDERAREIDRPPFKVLGNRTLLDIAERKPTKLAELAEIKGITDLLLRRLGRNIMAAVRKGRKEAHGPIPKLGGSRRRMDRHAERRLAALKAWRAERASDTKLDPGVLAPNSVLEAIAWRNPSSQTELEDLPELKGWFRREFGAEVVRTSCDANDALAAKPESKPQGGRRGRGRGRGRGQRSRSGGEDAGDAGEEEA
ncbi:MAG: ribonuclease D [Deltaproteobacteria bacterium]|nr:ribonuclease D [Deltaproteobacteria bacterium]MBW2359949.1 ribonuclease D [Deltaproteobacteria bacterium]